MALKCPIRYRKTTHDLTSVKSKADFIEVEVINIQLLFGGLINGSYIIVRSEQRYHM